MTEEKNEEEFTGEELTKNEIKEIRKFFYILKIDREISKRRLMYAGWIKAVAQWLVIVTAGVLIFRDAAGNVVNFITSIFIGNR